METNLPMLCLFAFPKLRPHAQEFAGLVTFCVSARSVRFSQIRILEKITCILRWRDSTKCEAIASFVHGQHAARFTSCEQAFSNGIADQFFHSVSHRTRAEFRMKSLAHQKREHAIP